METYGSTRIAGIGAYLPEQRISTDELMHEVNCRRFRIPEDYISRHIGIIEKRVAPAEMSPSDLAVLASKTALKDAGISADEIDLIIYTGITRDYEEPATAHNVQNKLGADNAVCMDVSNACLGFMTGISVGDSFIRNKFARNALVCTGEMPSKMTPEVIEILRSCSDKKEYKSTLGFLTAGDAGAAMILKDRNIDDYTQPWMNFISSGNLSELCYYEKTFKGLKGAMIMSELGKVLITLNQAMIKTTYKNLGWLPDQVGKLFCHQVGAKPHEQLIRVAGVTVDKAPTTYAEFGNLTSATIPVNMFLNPPNRGDKVLFFGSGSGVTICQGGMVF